VQRVIAAFLIAATAVALGVGLALLFPGRLLEWLAQFNRPGMQAFEALGRWSGALLLLVACFTAVATVGLLRGKKWGWWMAMGVFAVNGCGDIVGYTITRDGWRSGSGVVVSAGFVYALTRIRRSFN